MRREVGPWVTFGTSIWEKAGLLPFERAVVSYRFFIVTIALSLTIRPRFAVECLDAQINRDLGHFGQNLGRNGSTDAGQILTQSGTRHGSVVSKRNRVCSFCRLSTMHKNDRQTNRQTTER